MTGHSLATLLEWLRITPRTLGWDAIVSFNRGRANLLLEQQYIQNFSSENDIPVLSGAVTTENGAAETRVSGLQLSAPRLSFETADIDKSKAQLTFDIIGGLIVTSSMPDGFVGSVTKIQQALPLTGPKIFLGLDLRKTPGSANQAGQVTLDLKEGHDFTADFVETVEDQAKVGTFFRDRFAEWPPDQRVYRLGELGGTNGALTPKNFEIRTQAATGAKVRGAANYGDGAVVMFVTLRDGTDGQVPPSTADFKYLIPNDDNGARYSGAVLLAKHAVFGRLLGPEFMSKIGGGLDYDFDGQKLIASNGDLKTPKIEQIYETFYQSNSGHYHGYRPVEVSCPRITFPFEKSELEFRGHDLVAINDVLRVHWENKTRGIFQRYMPQTLNPPWGSVFLSPWYFYFTYKFSVDMKPVLEGDRGLVVFQRQTASINEFTMTGDTSNIPWKEEDRRAVEDKVREFVDANFYQKLQSLALPNIDSFLLANLLFPGGSHLKMSAVHLPGDLALFGQLASSQTSFSLSPAQPIVGFGGRQQLDADPPRANLRWTVRGPHGETQESQVGRVTDQGLYHAPAKAAPDIDFQRVIVSATSQDGQSSSALVSVVAKSVAVNPVFQICKPGDRKVIAAGALGGGAMQWALKAGNPAHGATLVPNPDPDQPGTRLYNPGQAVAPNEFTLDIIEVNSANVIARSYVLVIWRGLTHEVRIDDTWSAPGKVKLLFLDPGWDEPEPIVGATWRLLAGDGSVDSDGIFTQPDVAKDLFAVISAEYSAPGQTKRGLICLPTLASPRIAAPQNLRVTHAYYHDRSIHLAWNAVPDAVKYHVYNGPFRISTTASTTLIARPIVAWVPHFFTVRAVDAGGDVSAFSAIAYGVVNEYSNGPWQQGG